jgi:hypothetical protein
VTENSETILLLGLYFDEVADLAISIEKDIKNGRTISSGTVLALSKTIAAGQRINKFVDYIDKTKVKIN